MSFNLDDYVDVAERIRIFYEKYPEGSLQSEMIWLDNPGGFLCKAYAYRKPDDIRPGMGYAFEGVPGKTPYTKDSEAMNAETSAWGRAIVSLGFETKKIASANEVRARQGDTAGEKESKFKAPAAKPDEEAVQLAQQLIELVAQIAALDGTAEELMPNTQKAIEKHAGDKAWLKRQIKTAKLRLENDAKVPF